MRQVSQNERTPEQVERGYELFSVSVNVRSTSTVYFKLQYQQLLERKFGLYENRISVRPTQIVQHLSAEVDMYEPQGITDLTVFEPSFTNSVQVQDTVITEVSPSLRHIRYEPSAERQALISDDGNFGDLVIRYDVNHDDSIGLLQREGDYFVHFFSPNEENLQLLSKNIVFVIDISGSMGGRKMEQTRDAMNSILDQLNPDDQFMMLLFDDGIEYWPSVQEPVSASVGHISQAKIFADEKLNARGGTGINSALVEACRIVRQINSVRGKDMILFLTDGQPTSGETDPAVIIRNVMEACGRSSIFSLGFGFDLNYELLESLAYRTRGSVKRIYEDVDSAAQLIDFFRQISRPLLYDINIVYPSNMVALNSVTSTSFAQFFGGTELVVAGKFQQTATDYMMDVRVDAYAEDRYALASTVDTTPLVLPPLAVDAVTSGFIERLYVHIKIKDLLRQLLTLDDASAIDAARRDALQLALDYQLVTPLTSMIVVEPEEERTAEDSWPQSSPGGGGVQIDTKRRNNVYHSSRGSSSAAMASVVLTDKLPTINLCLIVSIGLFWGLI